MKKLSTLITILFSMTVTFPSYGDWISMGKNSRGDNYYLDLKNIRKNGGYFYFWDMVNYLKPNKWGTWSSKTYYELDCNKFRYKILSDINYKQPMGSGSNSSYNVPQKNWSYPPPNSMSHYIKNKVCSQ